ncbi:MAG: helix-turn-helix domain-containing protein [Oscillospiraceae bacterium]|nr:helix-turn-helix domain-containing protein [Oscillospiraceae bacterium]
MEAKGAISMNIEIGTKIKQLRLGCGMTQEQLGNELSVSAQAVSKWESGTTTPDIQLLPEISVLFGVSIDELFSMSDESKMDRIENMIDNVHFISDKIFSESENFLKEKAKDENKKARASLLLAELYSKRIEEYKELASELGRNALLLNPDEKRAHNVIFDADNGPYSDYNATNHVKTIDFYKEFLEKHPENPRTYLWLMDLLLADGRTAEAKEYLWEMDKIEHSFRTDLYLGLIAQAECDLQKALEHWEHMTEEFNYWLSWSCKGDLYARLSRFDEAIEFYEHALEIQEPPRYMDIPESMSFVAEALGNYEKAIEYRKKAIEICETDWNITEGEWVDIHKREIERLLKKMK